MKLYIAVPKTEYDNIFTRGLCDEAISLTRLPDLTYDILHTGMGLPPEDILLLEVDASDVLKDCGRLEQIIRPPNIITQDEIDQLVSNVDNKPIEIRSQDMPDIMTEEGIEKIIRTLHNGLIDMTWDVAATNIYGGPCCIKPYHLRVIPSPEFMSTNISKDNI